jgi:alkanesulfonate monooxygenase SsuD/methylene tetrahydromethanopterin reductase-like flavin-dependent oxidoreductase (luciferase family)
MSVRFPELGFYTLPGRVSDPRPLLQEVVDAERIGLGSVWISERQDVKEAATLSGAAGARTSELAVAVGVTNPNTRHPIMIAAIGSTMSALTGGRFALGLGRGFDLRSDMWGVPRVTGKMLEDTAALLRRLWAGDARAFDGAHYRLAAPTGFLRPEAPPPVVVGGFGPRMAGIAGRHADGFNTQAAHPQLADLIRVARDEHAAAGRDPARFLATVFAGWRDAYLDPASPARAALLRLGVDRLILLTEPPYDRERIRAGGRLLARPR